MNRRNFIKVIGTGAIIVAAPPLVIKGLSSKDEPRLRPVHDYQDIRKVLISYAMQCPNPHNKQPWKVSLDKDNVIRIFVDRQRLLPHTDPYHRQIHIGVGCFVDSLATVATHFDLQADIHYFPQGEYNNLRLEELPVADVILTNRESVVTNPLFAEMSRRQSTKTAYDPSPLHDTTFETISNLISDQNHYIDFISSDKDKIEMGKFLIDAMTIEESNKLRSLETISMFRFNDEEFIQFRDGFGLEQNGTFGIKKWIAETMFISREKPSVILHRLDNIASTK
ncbi:hypothetical protein L4C38_03270 [Vibrio kasasachensis]|uniref:hypothetical protein n=1 Tax=Vibrio kasasachensis TaxID=2910248 RepID=UPI003D0F7D92